LQKKTRKNQQNYALINLLSVGTGILYIVQHLGFLYKETKNSFCDRTNK